MAGDDALYLVDQIVDGACLGDDVAFETLTYPPSVLFEEEVRDLHKVACQKWTRFMYAAAARRRCWFGLGGFASTLSTVSVSRFESLIGRCVSARIRASGCATALSV